jgi:hypothetical protein
MPERRMLYATDGTVFVDAQALLLKVFEPLVAALPLLCYDQVQTLKSYKIYLATKTYLLQVDILPPLTQLQPEQQ